MVRAVRLSLVLLLGAVTSGACGPQAVGDAAALVLERTIPLPGVKGRIDHLALDAKAARLYVAALGNGSVEVVDLTANKVAGHIPGLAEPQGLAVLPERSELAVATGGDGALHLYDLATLKLFHQVNVGKDADNVRWAAGRVVVGAEGLVSVDPATGRVAGTVALPAHPEGFQLDGDRAFVNLPDAGQVGTADLSATKLTANWPNRGRKWNFPMALDRAGGEIAVAYRLPARLVLLDVRTGQERAAATTCGDSDDLFFDARRGRIYVVCGEGVVDVFSRAGGLKRIDRTKTSRGARTGLYSPDTDRLYVAARANGSTPTAILVFRPR